MHGCLVRAASKTKFQILEDILEPIGVTVDEFIKICDEFTNKKLFLTDKNGKLIKDKNGNLTKINYDNVEEDENK